MRLSLLTLVNRGREGERGGARWGEEREGGKAVPSSTSSECREDTMIYLAFLVLFLPGKRLIFDLRTLVYPPKLRIRECVR